MPITKNKIRNHFHYSFWKYLVLIAIALFGWNLIYTSTRYQSPENLKVEFYAEAGAIGGKDLQALADQIHTEIMFNRENRHRAFQPLTLNFAFQIEWFGDVSVKGMRYPNRVRRLIVVGANLTPTGMKTSLWFAVWRDYLYAGIASFFNPKWRHQRELSALMALQPHIPVRELRKLQTPTLVLAGTRDVIREKHTRRIASTLPHGFQRNLCTDGESSQRIHPTPAMITDIGKQVARGVFDTDKRILRIVAIPVNHRRNHVIIRCQQRGNLFQRPV